MGVKPSATNPAVPLFPQTISKRELPANFAQSDLKIFSHELEKAIPETSLLELRDVRVSAEGILFRQNKILSESFAFAENREKWKRRSVLKFFVSNYALRHTRTIERDVLWITDEWSGGYFHWLTDALSRLFVMRDRLDDFVLLLPWNLQSLDFVNESLKAFGVEAVEFIGRDEVLKCKRLFLPTHTAPSGHYNEQIIRGVREVLLETYGDDSADDRVYISRSLARKRRIRNEPEVSAVLEEFGFQTIRAEEHSFEQQVKISSRARYLVSNHGAGLTNMLFLREDSRVLELRHYADCINNCYFTLASALDLGYFYQTCDSADPLGDPHTADLIVEPQLLRTNLNLMLGPGLGSG
jgi:hypothetical protein